MESSFVVQNVQHHTLEMSDRKNLSLTGVKNIESFDSEEFLVETSLGHLLVKGKNLSLGKMDTDNGHLVIKGIIESIVYVSNNKNSKEKFVKRLFK